MQTLYSVVKDNKGFYIQMIGHFRLGIAISPTFCPRKCTLTWRLHLDCRNEFLLHVKNAVSYPQKFHPIANWVLLSRLPCQIHEHMSLPCWTTDRKLNNQIRQDCDKWYMLRLVGLLEKTIGKMQILLCKRGLWKWK